MYTSKDLFTTYNYLLAIELIANLESELFPKFDQDTGDDAAVEAYTATILALANEARRGMEIMGETEIRKGA